MRSLDLLDWLIAFPTVSQSSNLALVDWAQTLLRDAGFTVTRIPSPCGIKAGLFARIGPDGANGICLSGHTDVVPTEGQDWTSDPFRMRRDGARVIGRGTTDMKGFVASALALAERAGQADLRQPLSLVLSYDEEIGCVGLREMLPGLTSLIGHPRLVIVGEPTSMQIATGHKGKAALRVTCTGEAGHSALAPRFVNAIHIAAAFIHEIRALQDALAKGAQDPGYDIPYSTVHIGKIAGGRALNIVPDQAVIDMEFRHLAQSPASDLLKAISDAARRTEEAFMRPGAIEITQVNAYPGLNHPENAPILDWAAALSDTTTFTKVAFGTEAGYFAQLGLEAIVLGPGDMASDGHKPNEALHLDQLAACDAMMDRVLMRLCA